MAETFRGAILAVPRGEIEAGYAYGMTPIMVFTRITFPACVRHALPGFWQTIGWYLQKQPHWFLSLVLKTWYFARPRLAGSLRQPFTFYFVVAVLYLIITALSDVGLRWLDKRYSVGVRRA